ncbi:MAG: hypothetical protein AAGF77_13820 [Bacteroidota bacterium]
MYFLGFDLESFAIRLALVDRSNGRGKTLIKVVSKTMAIATPQSIQGIENTKVWWQSIALGIHRLITGVVLDDHLYLYKPSRTESVYAH